MTETQWYVLDVNPEPWAIGPVGYARHNGKMSAYVGQNKQLDTYKQTIKEAIADKAVMMSGKVDITFFFWRNRADYKTPQARSHRKHEADATNLQKSTEDALQNILYSNDKDNSHVQAYIIEQGPGVKGKVVICIKPYVDIVSSLIPADVWNQIAQLYMPPVDLTDMAYDESSDTLF